MFLINRNYFNSILFILNYIKMIKFYIQLLGKQTNGDYLCNKIVTVIAKKTIYLLGLVF